RKIVPLPEAPPRLPPCSLGPRITATSSTVEDIGKIVRSQPRLFSVTRLEALVCPVADIVEKIFHTVRILAARRFARRARSETVYGSFQNEVVLILAR